MAEFNEEHKGFPVNDTRDRSFFDGIPVSLYRTTPAGQFLDVNLALVIVQAIIKTDLRIQRIIRRIINPL